MAINIKILKWSSQGLRCPDHEISFAKEANDVYKIALVQMPNGTGKTTTLKLLRAALGGPKIWDTIGFEKPMQFRKDPQTLKGKFELTLLYDTQKRLTIALNFDFSEEGKVEYITVFGKGINEGFRVPSGLSSILKPDFIQLLMFDGELAANLLDADHTNAQRAIEEMYQLSFLQRMGARVDDYWNSLANGVGSKGSPKEFTQRKNKVNALKAHISEVTKNKNADNGKLDEINKAIHQLENQFQQELNKNKDDGEAINIANNFLSTAENHLADKAKEAFTLMKNPAELSKSHAQFIVTLKDSLDKVKLPGIAAREFFEEIADEGHCICGREIDKNIQKTIREGAKNYLGTEEVTVLNAMKTDIKERIIGNGIKKNGESLKKLIKDVSNAQETVLRARQKLDTVKLYASDNDPKIKKILEQINKLREEKGKLELIVQKYEDKTDQSDNSWHLDTLNRKLEEAEKDLANATDTVQQKEKRDILCRILSKALESARKNISADVCSQSNMKIKNLMPNNSIRIASIDKCLKLSDKEGGSVGETLTVGYAFLSSLLSSASHNLPAVVDSPSGPIDLSIRPEIAKLIPRLGEQFIAFIISSEREGFIKPLTKMSKENILFLTLFRKGNKDLEASIKSEKGAMQSVDGIWVTGQKYFENFHIEQE